MKRRRKLFAGFQLLLLMLFMTYGLLACSTADRDETEKKLSDAANVNALKTEIQIRFAQWSVSSDKMLDEVINGFNSANQGNIRMEVVRIPLDRYCETLNMLSASGEGPDVFELNKEWLNSYIYKNLLADLSSYVDDSFLGKFPEWAVKSAGNPTFENGFYSIPSNQITYRLIYNKDLFTAAGLDPEAPPKTLSELKRGVELISSYGEGKRIYGLAMPMGEAWVDFVQTMEAVNGYSGVYFYDEKKKSYDLTVYAPWLTLMKDLNEKGKIFPGMNSMKSDLAMTQFAEGNIGMMYAASWEVSMLLQQLSPKVNWGVALPPAINEACIGKGKVAVNTAGWNVVSTGTKYLEEAVMVWKYLYSDDYLRPLVQSGCVIPVKNNLMKDHLASDNFSVFLPAGSDSVYPDTPHPMDEWARKNVYMSVLSENQADNALQEESDRLNLLQGD